MAACAIIHHAGLASHRRWPLSSNVRPRKRTLMAASHPDSNPKERVENYVYLASMYFVSVGILYLWGYWSPFGINILEHLALTDVLKITAYPVATAVLLTAIGATIGEAVVSDRDWPPGGGRDSPIGRFLNRFGPQLLALLVVGTVGLLLFGPVEKWRILPALLGLPLFIAAKQAGLLQKLIPHESPRSIVLYLLATLPPLAYGQGLLAASKIQNGASFMYLLSKIPEHSAQAESAKALRYVGTAGDLIFFFDPLRTAVVLAKIDTNSPLVLKQYESHNAPVSPASTPASTPATQSQRGLTPR